MNPHTPTIRGGRPIIVFNINQTNISNPTHVLLEVKIGMGCDNNGYCLLSCNVPSSPIFPPPEINEDSRCHLTFGSWLFREEVGPRTPGGGRQLPTSSSPSHYVPGELRVVEIHLRRSAAAITKSEFLMRVPLLVIYYLLLINN